VLPGSGGLHILVNNAGIAIGGSLLEMSLEDWRRQQAINLDGVFLSMKRSIPLMRDSGGGSIINILSVGGLKGSANLDGMAATGVPMGVAGQPQDIANGVLFPASDDSSYLTGCELVNHGGIMA
jgi:NAD(P)-dependent dehydrogenase (short-subunit alcohol dehydrogenase family)